MVSHHPASAGSRRKVSEVIFISFILNILEIAWIKINVIPYNRCNYTGLQIPNVQVPWNPFVLSKLHKLRLDI